MTDKSAAAVRELAEHWMPMVRYKDKERFISVLTALISEGYVSKEEHDKVVQQRDELKEALAEMIWQFGYRSTYEGRESLHTGGLSALESAFGALGLSDPIALLDFEAAIKNTEKK